tara:strand:- start:184 stop:483 length:300 start_codon:yes stop_codon:yes gene_type:complete
MEYRKNITEEELDQKQKEFVWQYLREHSLINFNDEVISASKAFVVNAAFRWSVTEIKEKRMTETQWRKTKRMVDQYISGIVDLKWNKGKLISIEVSSDR